MVERTYTIPLRKGWLKAPRYKRAKKAITTVKEFLVKHMKSEEVKLGTHLNLEIWKHGIKNPPSRVKVNVSKDDKGVVKAELFGVPIVVEKKEEKKGLMKKLAEKVTPGKAKVEEKKEASTEAPKAEEKKVETPKEPETKKEAEVKKEAKPEKAEEKPAKVEEKKPVEKKVESKAPEKTEAKKE